MQPQRSDIPAFDDPGLKAAVRRAWGTDRAPDTLRSRVLAVAHAQPKSSAPAAAGTIRPDRPTLWQHPWLRYGLAAAAMVVVGFGLAYRLDHDRSTNELTGTATGTPVTFTSSAVPRSITDPLIQSHERCRRVPTHNAFPNLSHDNFNAVRAQLERRLGFPVLAGPIEQPLGRDGWRFRGAAVCRVGDVDAAHLLFVRGPQAISLFSLPRSGVLAPGPEPRRCEDANPDHPIAVFVCSDGVHCVVGSSPDRSLSVDQVRAVLDHLRPTLPASAPRDPGR